MRFLILGLLGTAFLASCSSEPLPRQGLSGGASDSLDADRGVIKPRSQGHGEESQSGIAVGGGDRVFEGQPGQRLGSGQGPAGDASQAVPFNNQASSGPSGGGTSHPDVPSNMSDPAKFPVPLALTGPVAVDQAQLKQARDSVVSAAYLRSFGRDPDFIGLTFWREQLERGMRPSDLKAKLDETSEGQVARLYFVVLARDPDFDGIKNWVRQHQSGTSIQTIEAEIRKTPEALNSAEIANRGPVINQKISQRDGALAQAISDLSALPLKPFLEAVYQECLGRNSDSVGLNNHLNALASGVSAQALRQGICSSQEASVAKVYFEVLSRDPDAEGRAFWMDKLSAGLSIEDIRAAAQQSAESETDGVVARRAEFSQVLQERAKRTEELMRGL